MTDSNPVPVFLRPVHQNAEQPQRVTVAAKRFPPLFMLIGASVITLMLVRRFMKRR